MAGPNPFNEYLKTLTVDNKEYKYYDLSAYGGEKYKQLPYSIRILLESAIRNCDNFAIKQKDVESILNWDTNQRQHANNIEIPFKPARVILQDLTGVPAVVDFAAMRDAIKDLGGDPEQINPQCPADLVIDHSIQVDFVRSPSALQKNEELEFERNQERFEFLKWGSKAFNNMLIIPPGSGIVHQVNLEYLARVVFTGTNHILYPDTVVGTDSHTTMINGLGIVGWGVGGIEAEAVMLGQSIIMLLPQVIGYRLHGKLGQYVTSTDLVLTITKHLRQLGCVGKFVEFYGPGIEELSIADRATISNMCPEYGATVGFFACDYQSLNYLRQTNRSEAQIRVIEAYLKATEQLRDYSNETHEPIYSETVHLDLATVVSSVSGPKRPNDRVSVSEMKNDFSACLTNKIGFKGFGLTNDKIKAEGKFMFNGEQYTLRHGSVVIAAITSCTNTSNPSVMLGAGLLAKNACKYGLKVPPYIKTSLSPGSGVVTYYLRESKVLEPLQQLGFDIVGYGCMTCIGNSGNLDENIINAIETNDLICCGVLSGNRNFEGRIHPNTRANYLASPLLVIAYALAGTVDIDFDQQPLGRSVVDGKPVYLRDIWPTRKDIHKVEQEYVIPAMFQQVYSKIQLGSQSWQTLNVPTTKLYPWSEQSTYIKKPPFFNGMSRDIPRIKSIKNAYCLLYLGDSVTTDHISPAGSIGRNSPAARYLSKKGLQPKDFNSYGSRRGNDAIMVRGTFANIRLVNKFLNKSGPRTLYLPTNEEMDIFDCAERYQNNNTSLIVIAGKDYGSGSSRDWAAKGPFLLGIKAVIAESFERIHRSNLVGMGIMPLQFQTNETAESLGLTGREIFNIELTNDLKPGQLIKVITNTGKEFNTILRFDTEIDLLFYQHGGILHYMIRKILG